MPAALEFYKANNFTRETENSSTYNTHTSLTVDRSGEAGTKNFIIIAHIATAVSDTAALVKVRLYQDSTTVLGEVADGLEYGDVEDSDGFTYNFVKRVSLDNTSHTIDVDFARESGSGDTIALNSSIIAIEESANTEYAENTSASGTGSSNNWETGLALTFTPASEQNYVFVWAAEIMFEDESSSRVDGVRLNNTTDSNVFYSTETGDLMTGNNDGLYHTVGGVAYETVETSSHNYEIQINGGGSTTEAYIRRAAIVALPVGDFENAYLDSQTTETSHQGDTATDTNVSITQSVNAADHLIIGGGAFSNENASTPAQMDLISASNTYYNWADSERDSDGNEYWIKFSVDGQTLTSGSKTFKIQGNSPSTSSIRKTKIKEAYLVVLEIPASTGTDVTVSPSVQTVTSSQASPTVSTTSNITASPSSQDLSTSNPNPSVSAAENVTTSPDSQNLTSSNPSATVDLGALINPNSQTVSTSNPSVVVTAVENVSVSPSSVDLTTSQPDPSVSTQSNLTLSPSSQTLTTSIPGVAISVNESLAQDPQNLTVEIPTPTITAVQNTTVSTGVQTLTASIPIPSVTVETNATVSVTPQDLTLSNPTPTVDTATHATINPIQQDIITSQPAPTITAVQNINVALSSIDLTSTQPTSSVTAVQNIQVDPESVGLTLSLQSSSTIIGDGASPSSQNLTLSTPSPSVTAVGNTTISADTIGLTLSTPTPIITADSGNITVYPTTLYVGDKTKKLIFVDGDPAIQLAGTHYTMA